MFLVPVAVLLAPGEGDLARFAANFAFYAIFSAVIPTAMTRVMFMSEAFQSAADAVSRVEEVLAAPVIETPVAPRLPRDNSVVFRDVSFTYAGAEEPALDHVSFEVPAGATVALVGPSGGGKTTAASLVPRFWDAGSGSLLVGGVDVRDMDPHDLMDRVAFVFQANRLFKPVDPGERARGAAGGDARGGHGRARRRSVRRHRGEAAPRRRYRVRAPPGCTSQAARCSASCSPAPS